MTKNKVSADFILHNLDTAVVYPNPYRGRGTSVSWETKELKHVSIASKEGKIVWIGDATTLNENVNIEADAKFYNGEGLLATPGFVDSHTHLLYAGNRADEFEMRVQGKTYLEIMAANGGILCTTNAVRSLSEGELFAETADRLEQAMETGVSTIEIKTGYGLDLENELKMLRVIEMLKEEYPLRIVTTFMGAHAIPADRLNDIDSFVDEICEKWIPAVAETGCAKFNDVFTEKKAFSVEQSEKILKAGLKYGLKAKIHADEINVIGGVDLAAEIGATSADHLLMTNDEGIKKLVGSGVIPTLLPGTSTFLMESHHAPARKMIEAGLPVAVASDHNPGSCQFLGANLTQSMSMLQLRMSASEALIAGTLHAAHALDMGNETGALEVGRYMDVALFDLESFRQIGYHVGQNYLYDLIINGNPVYTD